MITRRMFLSDALLAVAAAGCSTSEPVPGKGSVASARSASARRIEEDLERYFQLLIEAGRLPASPSPGELVKRVYQASAV